MKKQEVRERRADCISEAHGITYCLDRVIGMLEKSNGIGIPPTEVEALSEIVADIAYRAHVLRHKIRSANGK